MSEQLIVLRSMNPHRRFLWNFNVLAPIHRVAIELSVTPDGRHYGIEVLTSSVYTS